MAATPKPTPRWLYAFFDFIERLPGPAWLLGLLVILTGSLGLHVAAWRQGLLPYGSLDSYLITLTVFPVMSLAAWAFLDGRARTALASFAKSKGKQDRGLERMVTDFISLPNWIAIFSFASGILSGYLNFNVAIGLSPLGGNVFLPYELLSFLLVSGLQTMTILRAVFQAVRLHRLLKGVEVNIFNPAPLYALSRYASQSTLTLVLLNYILVFISLPDFLLTTNGGFILMLAFAPMLMLFFAPLSSVNQRMRAEKERLLAELGDDLNGGVARVLRAVRGENYSEINKIRNSISSLKETWEIVKKISTWPWEAETVRNLLIPFLIPVVAFLVQRFLGSMLGG
jgi:hypothetical protein